MKKTIALILAIIMMAAIAVPAFAEDVVTETIPAESGVTMNDSATMGDNACYVTYGVRESYTVSLPTAISFAYTTGTVTMEATLAVSDSFVIDGKNKLVITMDSPYEGENNGWEMRATNGSGSADVPYTVTASALDTDAGKAFVHAATGNVENLETGNSTYPTVLAVDSNVGGIGGGVKLTFSTKGTKQAGDYKDTITFAVSIQPKA